MLDNLLFSLDRIIPFFLLIMLGTFLVRKGGVPKSFFDASNSFVFNVALPANVFCSIAAPDSPMLNFGVMAFSCLFAMGSFFVAWGVTEVMYRKNKALIGTLVQGIFRCNMALIGIPLVTAVAGEDASQLAVAGVAAVVPVYGAFSIFVLAVRGKNQQKIHWLSVLKSLVTNRLILAVVLGLPFMLLRIQMPSFAFRTLDFVGQIAAPLGLITIGGLFNLKDATARLGPALYATVFKIVAIPIAVAAAAYLVGYRGVELLALFLIFATPTAFSSYAFASSMGGDAPLASNILILTTLFSSFTFAVGIYVMKTLGVF
jgi:predicted permease